MTQLKPEGTRHFAIFLLITVLAAGIRFYAITDAYVWYDEAFSVWISALSPEAIWFHTGRDVHPPLYYLLLHCWMEVFGKTPLSIRSLSAIAGTLTVPLGVLMARSVFGSRASLVFGLFLALLPMSVRLSQEARMYAVEAMFLMGATLALIYWMRKSAQYRYCLLYALCMTAALYTHYYAVLAALVHWLYLIVLRVHPSVKAPHVTSTVWWMCNALVAIAYVPWLFSLFDLIRHYAKIEEVGSVAWLAVGNFYTLPDTVWRFFTLLSPQGALRVGYWLVPIAMMVATGWVVFQDRTKYRFSILLTFFSFVPMLVLFCLSLLMPAYLERYVAFSAAGLPLLLTGAIVGLGRTHAAVSALLFFCVIGLELIGLNAIYNQDSEVGYVKSGQAVRMEQVFNYIRDHRQKTDMVVVGGGFFYFSAAFYNGSDKGLYLLDESFGREKLSRPNGYGASTLMLDTWDEHFLVDPDGAPNSARRVWWVTGNPSLDVHHPYRGKRLAIDYLPAGDLELRLYQAL